MWLRLGKPLRALKALQQLTRHGWKHPWTETIFWRAAQYID
jgi:hypothetical protein